MTRITIDDYKRTVGSLVHLFKGYPVTVIERGVDILNGDRQHFVEHSYISVVDTVDGTADSYLRAEPVRLDVWCLFPPEQLRSVQYSMRQNGDSFNLAQVVVSHPQITSVLGKLKDNKDIYLQSQQLNLLEFVRDLRLRRINYIENELKRLSYILGFDDGDFHSMMGMPLDHVFFHTVHLAIGNYVACSEAGEVQKLASLCANAYLPEEINEVLAQKVAQQKASEAGIQRVDYISAGTLDALAQKIGFERTELALGRKITGMWVPLGSGREADEMWNELRIRNPALHSVLLDLEDSYKPYIPS